MKFRGRDPKSEGGPLLYGISKYVIFIKWKKLVILRLFLLFITYPLGKKMSSPGPGSGPTGALGPPSLRPCVNLLFLIAGQIENQLFPSV